MVAVGAVVFFTTRGSTSTTSGSRNLGRRDRRPAGGAAAGEDRPARRVGQGPEHGRHRGPAGGPAGQSRAGPVLRRRHRPGHRHRAVEQGLEHAADPGLHRQAAHRHRPAHLGRPDQPVRHQGRPGRPGGRHRAGRRRRRHPVGPERGRRHRLRRRPADGRPGRPGQGQRRRRQADRAGHRLLVRSRPRRRLADRRHPRHRRQRAGLHHPDVAADGGRRPGGPGQRELDPHRRSGEHRGQGAGPAARQPGPARWSTAPRRRTRR